MTTEPLPPAAHTMSPAERQRSANAVGGRTARACDSCLRRRARWYCAADDAFLCQSCDSTVHSANTLARRHDRIRLKTSSSSSLSIVEPAPSWLQGFTRKPRTPRPHHSNSKQSPATAAAPPVVPDMSITGEYDFNITEEEEEEQLLYQVPIFDPDLAVLCPPAQLVGSDTNNIKNMVAAKNEIEYVQAAAAAPDGFARFHPSDVDLAEFDAAVESLLAPAGFDDHDDNNQFCMEGLGMVEAKDEDCVKMDIDFGTAGAAQGCHVDVKMEFARETLDVDFDYRSPAAAAVDGYGTTVDAVEERRLGLRLDYEAVISAWSGHGGSPWTDGRRPQLNPNDCWPDYTGMWRGGGEAATTGVYGSEMAGGSAGREARVSRYREKRRTRLFSKKIRYEVRKLNAEKRPRMKGRFVKRASFSPATAVGGGSGCGFPY